MISLVQVLNEHWQNYVQANRSHIAAAHYRAVRAVQSCRTPVLGGRLYRCDHCNKTHFAYHSCNHRNCSQCGAIDQKKWAAKQEAKLLPVPYFMVTFTVPDKLRYLFARYPKELYDLLLKESAGALTDIVATKYKGGRIGFTSVLHTWGRQMQHHPHVHCIVPAAIYHSDTDKVTLTKIHGEFLVHYRPLADRFRSRFYSALKDQHPEIFTDLTKEARASLSPACKWNVHLKHVGKGESAVRYLARYVFRSAFSPARLLGYNKDGNLRLQWTSSSTNQKNILNLSPHEFIRRWLIHVLPKGFMRVRHFGYLGSAAGKTREKIRKKLGATPELTIAHSETEPFSCPHCDKGKLVFSEVIERIPVMLFAGRGPPSDDPK